jgi:TPP-dependent pyruvate/acetoin dehydrogenase alpha subunit
MTLADVGRMQARVDAEVARAASLAMASPFPSVTELLTNVYA